MRETARRIAGFLMEQPHVRVVTHIDADGITSGAIASLALDRAGVPNEVEFIKQLDNQKVDELRQREGVIWFTDLGSAKLDRFDPARTVVTDHHMPQSSEEISDPGRIVPPVASYPSSPSRNSGAGPQTNLFDFSTEPSDSPSAPPPPADGASVIPERANKESNPPPDPQYHTHLPSDPQYHLNPHLFGHSGATEISGAGLTYLVAREMDEGNRDLSGLAIVGAVGDLQDSANCRLVGFNRSILEEAIEAGAVEMSHDVRYFGRETRPILKLLQYASDPIVPTVSGGEGGALEFLLDNGIEIKDGDHFRRWIDLDTGEKKTLISSMVRLCLMMGVEPDEVQRMVGEVYTLPREEEGIPLHDAKEFATMLNACGKNLHPEVGLEVCRGDRDAFLSRANTLLQGHRRNLAVYIQLVEQELGITQGEMLQFFDAGTRIPENLVGIVAGMVLNSGSADLSKVIIGLATAENGRKVSARTTRALVNKGVDLAEAMKLASTEFGGEGGGHNIAAGAFIPADAVDDFIEYLERLLKRQVDS
jgi:single-stranded-DNA-specific exonuclease